MLENIYIKLLSIVNSIIVLSIPYFRRVLRFLALPYCFFKLINWNECTVPRFQVIKDLLYIFFILKYFPDNYSLCRLWEKERSEWIFYYGSIYDPYQRGRLRKHVQKKEYEIVFKNKDICHKLCQASNLPVPKQYGLIEPLGDYKKTIREIFEENKLEKVIIKPVEGRGGKGILLAYLVDDPGPENQQIMIQDGSERIMLKNFVLTQTATIQHFLNQDSSLSVIAPSVNTLRVVTLYTVDNQVLVVGALMRFGKDNAYVDNTSRGGVAVGVNLESGTLKCVGYDLMSRKYYTHPTSKFIFEDHKIPHWDDALLLARKTQNEFSFYKLLGIDIAITADGPVIVEINGAYDNVGFEQKCGPILSDSRVRHEFKRHNLLINRVSRI